MGMRYSGVLSNCGVIVGLTRCIAREPARRQYDRGILSDPLDASRHAASPSA
jgi:hypothetical protein